MSTKDNFVKALKELTGLDENETKDSGKAVAEAGSHIEPVKVESVKVQPVKVEVEAPVVNEPEFKQSFRAKAVTDGNAALEFGQFTKGEQTSIPKGMRIIGNVESTDRLQILGKIEGNVVTTGDVVVTGIISGDVNANNISLQNAGVKGDIKATANVTIERDAKVVGSVSAKNLRLDGRIKGNVNVEETSEMASGALVIGDIETGYISTSRGTKIKGNIITKKTDSVDDDFDIEV